MDDVAIVPTRGEVSDRVQQLSNTTSILVKLPTDLMRDILSFLSIKDQAQMAQTCTHIYDIMHECDERVPSLFAELFAANFPQLAVDVEREIRLQRTFAPHHVRSHLFSVRSNGSLLPTLRLSESRELELHSSRLEAIIALPEGGILSRTQNRIQNWGIGPGEPSHHGVTRYDEVVTAISTSHLAYTVGERNGHLSFFFIGRRTQLVEPRLGIGQRFNLDLGCNITSIALHETHREVPLLLLGCEDGALRMCRTDGQEMEIIHKQKSPIVSLIVLANGQIAWGTKAGGIRLWMIGVGKPQVYRGFPKDHGTVRVEAELSGGRLICRTEKGSLFVWRRGNRNPRLLRQAVPHTGAVASLPGDRLVIGRSNGIDIWDTSVEPAELVRKAIAHALAVKMRKSARMKRIRDPLANRVNNGMPLRSLSRYQKNAVSAFLRSHRSFVVRIRRSDDVP